MKKTILLFSTLLLSLNLLAQYNWQALSTAPQSWRNDDIYFLNTQMGWAIHPYYSYLPPAQLGQIYKTRDGGTSWQLMKDSSKTFFRSVGFADSLTGWVGNLADTSMLYGAQITSDTIPLYQTNDGGATWSPVNLPSPHPAGVCGISVASDSVIYAYGRYFGPPRYAKTIDKGSTWQCYDMSSNAYGLVDGWFFNKDTGFITGASPDYNAQILSTVDGGNTWQVCYRASRNDSDEVWKIFFPSRNIGYGAIEYQALSTPKLQRYFVKTIDGGKTWTEMPFVNSYDEEGIGFINDSVGWIGGDVCASNYITRDGGKTWSSDNSFGIKTPPYVICNTGFSMNRFRKLNDSLMYASGNTVYKLNEKTTGINELPADNGTSVMNYPNPFSQQTTISYTFPKRYRFLTIDVFNELGEKVFSQNFVPQGVGQHQFALNLNLPAGIYTYTLTTDNDMVSNRMEVYRWRF